MTKQEFLVKFGANANDTKRLTGDEALAAVKQNWSALRFVQKQTEEICLEAVKQSCSALRFVQKQTEEICLAAVEQNWSALQYVDLDVFEDDEEVIELNGRRYKPID